MKEIFSPLKPLFNGFLSFAFILAMLFVLALGAGVATFIEKYYTSDVAKYFVYNAHWYEAVMILLAVSIIGVICRFRLWRKPGMFFLHFGFVVILIGAGLTRYFGQEGILHLAQGETKDYYYSEFPYFTVQSGNFEGKARLEILPIKFNYFNETFKIGGKDFGAKLVSIKQKAAKGYRYFTLQFELSYAGKTQILAIDGNNKAPAQSKEISFDGVPFLISWGQERVALPFKVGLKRFVLDRYPGSQMASSYKSEVEVTDEGGKWDYDIYMNHTLTHKGYKLFQTSYDMNEQGTFLTVNKDPGKIPTYIGYVLLALGFLLGIFSKQSRFMQLRSSLAGRLGALALAAAMFYPSAAALASDNFASDNIEAYKLRSWEHSKKIAALPVQDPSGRIKPLDSVALEVANKLIKKSSIFGLTHTQILLAMMTNPLEWEKNRMIRVSDPAIRKILGLEKDDKYIAFKDVLTERGYVLAPYLQTAHRTPPAKRSVFDKEIIKLDERLNIAFMIYANSLIKIFPKPSSGDDKWYSVQEVMSADWAQNDTDGIKKTIENYFNAIGANDYRAADLALDEMKAYQKKHTPQIVPRASKISAEILSNRINIFEKLTPAYLLLGIFMLFYGLANVFRGKESHALSAILTLGVFVAAVFHTAGLLLRWYISDHAPWSDSYESLIYIAWASVIAGIALFRRYMLVFGASVFLAAIVMFVAHLSWLDPQITNLVPVLKSFWLTIHVSVITASYAFLAIGALLGFITLVLLPLSARAHLRQSTAGLASINEMSLIIGLAMLTVGNFLGGVWANESWGRYWGWDPKETWSMVSIVVYVIILHLRFIPKLNSVFVFSLMSVLGFYSILMTYFGVNFYLTGLHSYAQGEPNKVGIYALFSLFVVAAIALLAYYKKPREHVNSKN
ncbi:MAG: cytochrome c biogenesis protein CcsA [Helicobacteraceae bacterium]